MDTDKVFYLGYRGFISVSSSFSFPWILHSRHMCAYVHTSIYTGTRTRTNVKTPRQQSETNLSETDHRCHVRAVIYIHTYYTYTHVLYIHTREHNRYHSLLLRLQCCCYSTCLCHGCICCLFHRLGCFCPAHADPLSNPAPAKFV